MGRLTESLEAIEDTLRRRAPSVLRAAGLRPPATETMRKQVAEAVGLSVLPEELDELFRWHDGQDGIGSVLEESVDFGGWTLCSTESAVSSIRWGARGDLPQWCSRYVPVAESGSGDVLVVDVGKGELVWWSHEGYPPSHQNESLAEFFERHADAWAEVTADLA